MFTGIVEGTAELKRITRKRGISTLEIDLGSMRKGLKKGHSVCCEGVCLTAVRFRADRMSVEVMQETLDCTNLGQLKAGDIIEHFRVSGPSMTVSEVAALHLMDQKDFHGARKASELPALAEEWKKRFSTRANHLHGRGN